MGSVHELLGAGLERCQPPPQARQVELSLQVSGDSPDAALNLLRLSQALGNILGNAIPCTETGGIS